MNILELANPAGLWWAAVALPIALLYILKVRLRRQPVSTFLFWDKVFHEKKPRSWWQQLRHLLSLLLQIALVALLVMAIVDPLWQWQKTQRRKVLLVLDNSASMAADDGGKTRLAKAKETASALVRSLRVGDEMAILAAGGKPEVAIGLTDHARSLLDAVNRIVQTDAPSALNDTVLAAKRLLVGDTRSSIYVLTDGCDPAVEALMKDESITVVGLGTTQDNQGITQFQVRRSLLDAIGYQTLIEVSNFSEQPYKGRVELSLEGQLVDVVPVELEPGANKTMHLDHASATGGRLVATLDSRDALASDDRAMAVLPTRRPIRVGLITPGSLFLKSVLESIPLVDVQIFQAAAPPATEGGQAAPTSFVMPDNLKGSITILHRLVPAQLPPGKLLIIQPQSSCDLWTVGQPIEQPIVASVSDKSPVTQHVKLSNVLFPDARALTFTADADLLIKTPLDEPLLAHVRRPSGDVLILNVDLDQGDLPLRIAFPVMMKNALEWFDGSPAELQPAIAAGDSTQVKLPMPESAVDVSTPGGAIASTSQAADAVDEKNGQLVQADDKATKHRDSSAASRQVWVRDPRGELTPLAMEDGTATLSVMKHSGLWTIGAKEDIERDPWGAVNTASTTLSSTASNIPSTKPSDSASKTSSNPASNTETTSDQNTATSASSDLQRLERLRHLACNLSNREESDLRPRAALPSVDQFGLLSLGGRSIWFYCVLLALALVAVEWWLYQRRIVG